MQFPEPRSGPGVTNDSDHLMGGGRYQWNEAALRRTGNGGNRSSAPVILGCVDDGQIFLAPHSHSKFHAETRLAY